MYDIYNLLLYITYVQSSNLKYKLMRSRCHKSLSYPVPP